MEIRELAPALHGIADLVQEANRVINRDSATIRVSVETGFRRGSIETDIGLTLIAAHQGILAFGTNPLHTARQIGEYIGLVTGVKPSLIGVLKWLKGLKPQVQPMPNGTVNLVISVNGDNNVINCPQEVHLLNQDPNVRAAAMDMLRPVQSEGIDAFEVRSEQSSVLQSVGKEDLPSFEPRAPDSAVQDVDATSERVALVEVIKPSFDSHLKWMLSDGAGGRFSATMKDDRFAQDVATRARAFGKGDLLRVELTAIPRLANGKLHTEYEINRVIDHIFPERQARLGE